MIGKQGGKYLRYASWWELKKKKSSGTTTKWDQKKQVSELENTRASLLRWPEVEETISFAWEILFASLSVLTIWAQLKVPAVMH